MPTSAGFWVSSPQTRQIFRLHFGEFRTGFLAFGSLYAVLSLTPCFYQNLGHRLLTTTILDMLYPSIPPLRRSTNTKPSPWELWTGRPSDYDHFREHSGVNVSTADSFLVIGHSLFAMLAAAGGGLLARRFYETRTREEERREGRPH